MFSRKPDELRNDRFPAGSPCEQWSASLRFPDPGGPHSVLGVFRQPEKGSSAAWRIAFWPTVAFALGSAIAFAVIYFLIAKDIRGRSDAWLTGEAETLADVSSKTPRDDLYARMVEEVAELATREVADDRPADATSRNTVFFLQTVPGQSPIWVGPEPKDAFLITLQNWQIPEDSPVNVAVRGWQRPFRVVRVHNDRGAIYLGLLDIAGTRMLTRLTQRFLLVWGITVALGFLITWLGAYRTLARVEELSQTVSRIGSEDLSGRLPEGRYHDEISRLSATFNRMLDRIQSSVNQLRVLTDSIAHDLKSPVTSIRGTLEVALSAGESGNWRDRVGEAVDGLDRLTKVLNTALDLAEADAGALVLRKEPVDITEIIEQLVDLYRPALAERKHQIVTTLQPLLVDADVSLLTRMLTNLLDNEIAHLPPGCRVSIDVRAREAEAEIVVADNGPGFPPDLRNRAFERFVKGEHSTGHGLGLAFVDAVVQAHGGHVLLTDHPGTGGAEIVLRMPLLEVLAEKA